MKNVKYESVDPKDFEKRYPGLIEKSESVIRQVAVVMNLNKSNALDDLFVYTNLAAVTLANALKLHRSIVKQAGAVDDETKMIEAIVKQAMEHLSGDTFHMGNG